MIYKQFKFCLVFYFGVALNGIQAQEANPATGGEATGSGGSASYSVGQIVYTTNIGANGSAAQGLHQPYEISVVTGLKETKGINLSVSAYPNPTTDYLTLEVKDFEFSTLHFQLYDMSGKLLQNEKITSNQKSIVMSYLVPASYLVKVIKGNKEVKTFKVIKK